MTVPPPVARVWRDVNAVSDANGNPRWSLPRRRILLRALRSDPTQEYLLQLPERGAVDAPVMVSVHGISRNAHEQAREFSDHCNERGVVLVVPIFTVEQHRDYQRLGRRGRGIRADRLLHDVLAEVATLTGANVSTISLFGFSGGAQFAHRYLMAHPHRVSRAVVASSGWYTFPDHRERYPIGVRTSRRLPGVNFNPESFLRVPVTVLVGADDTGTANLRRTERVDAMQGRTRVERARSWVRAMRSAADSYGLPPLVTLEEVPGVDHSFVAFCRRGDLPGTVFRNLFDVDSGESAPRVPGQPAGPAANEVADARRR